MNPVDQFEQCLRQLSTSKMPPADKSRKMLEVNQAIEHYLKRVEAQTYQDGAKAAVDLAKTQLRDLASQASQLAEVYRRAASVTLH
jgi:formyltetrahydrofolate synthetase